MGVDEGNLQVIDVDVILENCPITIVVLNLLVYNSTKQYYSNIAIITVYDINSKCHQTISHYIMSCSVVHKKRYDIIGLATTLRFRFTTRP